MRARLGALQLECPEVVLDVLAQRLIKQHVEGTALTRNVIAARMYDVAGPPPRG